MNNQNPTPNPTPTPPTENIPAQNTAVPQTPPQAYTAPQPATPPPSPKSFFSAKIILLIVFLLILLSAGGTYLALNSKPQPKPAPPTAPTPLPSVTSVKEGDPTANWKTYANIKYGYSLKYPNSLVLKENQEDTRSLLFDTTDHKSGTPGAPPPFYVSVIPDGLSQIENAKDPIYNFQSPQDINSFSTMPIGQTYLSYKRLPDLKINNEKAIAIENDKGNPEFTQKDRRLFIKRNGYTHEIGSYYLTNQELEQFNQILSTFKFTETSPTPTCRPRPACLDATPRCLIPETPDMCRPSITPPPGGGIVCTQEAKLCPDGKTYVGRQGPKCEFAACPGQ